MPDSWYLRGKVLVACNCDWGCPCNFNAPPTTGKCEGGWSWYVEEGAFGDVRLDGLNFSVFVNWPGAIHEGNGEAMVVIAPEATEAQRHALLTILSGQETEPGATIFNVFSTTFTKMHEPMFAPIEFEMDLDRRIGRIKIAGVVDTRIEPIRNPVTGEEHRARVVLPHGFEYLQAEYASGDTRASGAVALDWTKSHAHLTMLDLSTTGAA